MSSHGLAHNVAPLFLRVSLGVTFLWAGWGKMLTSMDYAPEQAAMLANMGVNAAERAARRPAAALPSPAASPSTAEPDSAPPADESGDEPLPEPDERSRSDAAQGTLTLVQDVTPAQAAGVYTAADFDAPVRMRKVHQLALLLHSAASGESGRRLWPSNLGTGSWPVTMGYIVGLTELLGGACVLLGLLTRIGALALAGVMLGAMWLTQIGPALDNPDAFLGFLPPLADFGPGWTNWLFQLGMLMSALALACLGAGCLSLDRLIFGRRRRVEVEIEDADD